VSVKGRIVVIDDEVNAASALETLLREDGYEVGRANDARTGLALLEKSDPDIVLTDLRMPGMDGLELLAAVRARSTDVPVVMLSSATETRILLQAIHDCRLDALIRSLRTLRDLEVTALLPGHLTVALRDGQSHIERANEILDRLLIPEQLVGVW